MIIKTKNTAFPYNNESQVKNWVAKLLGLDFNEISIQLVTSIGWNGSEYISSTDWKVRTSKGVSVFHPAAVPQYDTFVAIKGGMNVIKSHCDESWWLNYDHSKTLLVMPDGTEHKFSPGESIEIAWAVDAQNILLSDCPVKLEENEEERKFTILADEKSTYGEFINGTFWPK